MARDLDSAIDESMSHEERAVVALEAIADALTMWSKIEAQRFERDYPEKREPRDATVTHIPSEEDKLRANIHGPEETISEWLKPGTFESRFDKSLENPKRPSKAPKTRGAPQTRSDRRPR